MQVFERIDGNGLTYEENNPKDLAGQLLKLASPDVRQKMGQWGVKKVREHYSWNHIAQQRLQDYEAILPVERRTR